MHRPFDSTIYTLDILYALITEWTCNTDFFAFLFVFLLLLLLPRLVGFSYSVNFWFLFVPTRLPAVFGYSVCVSCSYNTHTTLSQQRCSRTCSNPARWKRCNSFFERDDKRRSWEIEHVWPEKPISVRSIGEMFTRDMSEDAVLNTAG